MDLLLLMSVCKCGKRASKTCGEGAAPLIPCGAPVCKDTCPTHRHFPGTMGYPVDSTVTVQWEGFHASSWKEWPIALFYNFLASDKQRALRLWKDVCSQFSPPAPLPKTVKALFGSKWVRIVDGEVDAISG